jgi:hypothetical protein
VRSIGSYLGWLGWQTFSLIGNNITQLGYPGNLDFGLGMILTQSNVYRRRNFAGEIGSAQWAGTSGGPWVQNFGITPVGQVPIGPTKRQGFNRVVGVSSYGAGSLSSHNTTQMNEALVLNRNFVRLYNSACAAAAGNC